MKMCLFNDNIITGEPQRKISLIRDQKLQPSPAFSVKIPAAYFGLCAVMVVGVE